MPPVMKNEAGEFRNVGYELEFSDLPTLETARLIMAEYGGKIEEKNRYYLKIVGSSPGDFTVKIDSSFLYDKKYKRLLNLLGIDAEQGEEKNGESMERTEEILESVFSTVVPYEIVAPPVRIDQMEIIDRLRKILLENKAAGTGSSAFYAFAVHINPELPVLNTETLIDYLRAFLILYPWLRKRMNPDYARRLTTFINPFPADYIRKILRPDYNPDLSAFLRDYHEFNPDRNRPLDLYPALAMLDERTLDLPGIGNVSPRPTLHFRMPDSQIDRKDWTLATEWNHWYYVEVMASDKSILKEMCRKYLEMEKRPFSGLSQKWVEEIDKWAEDYTS